MARLFQQLRFGNLFRRFKKRGQDATDWQIPPFVVAAANWPQVIERPSDFFTEGLLTNPGAGALLARSDTSRGIFDVHGMVSFRDVSTANIELRLSITRLDITSITQDRSFLTRSADAGFANVWQIPPFAFETDGDTTFQLHHIAGLGGLSAVTGWLIVSQRN